MMYRVMVDKGAVLPDETENSDDHEQNEPLPLKAS